MTQAPPYTIVTTPTNSGLGTNLQLGGNEINAMFAQLYPGAFLSTGSHLYTLTDVNTGGIVDAQVLNAASGPSVAATLAVATLTTNSYVGLSQVDNNGAPYSVLQAGAGSLSFKLNAGPITYTPTQAGTALTLGTLGGGALVLNQVAGYDAITINSGSVPSSGAITDFQISRVSTAANNPGQGVNLQFADTGGNSGSMFQHAGGQTELYQYDSGGGWNQVLACNTNLDLIGRGIDVVRYTAAQQSNGTGTLATDAYLVTPSLKAGTYRVRLFLQFYESASATAPGFRFALAVGGSVTGYSWLNAQGVVNNATYVSLFSPITATVLLHPIQSNSTTGSDFLMCEGIVTTTTAGTISLTWASYASGNGANPAVLNQNSYLEVERMS